MGVPDPSIFVFAQRADRDAQPGDAPEFTFRAPYAKGIVIRAYCNKHGLWEATV